ncbi:MAG TPA: efflux RND transporter periplasmic adaptor subunit [Gammaproteobacteria bacterium]|nr:efflux RND transporter periplasmic adaptor subunit [Gammaproteobacteria bacterium]
MSCKECRDPLSRVESVQPAAVAAALLSLTLLLGACDKSAPEARGAVAPATAGPIPVITQPARVEPMGIEIEAVGTTQANESVEVTSKASNTVTAIRFREGEIVERGAVLVEMDASQARASLAEAQAALARSKSQYDRSRDLQSRQAMSMADLEQVEASLKADEARVAAAQARLDDTVIRASFHGRTGFRHVSVGSFVSPGTLITTLDDTSVIKLDFTVPETYLFVLSRGLAVKAEATGLPDRVFEGTVTNMDSRIDAVTRSVTVRAELANPDGLLRQGMFMTVSLHGELTPTLLVPEEALVPERGKAYLFVVNDNVVERREVHTGKRRPGFVEIVNGVAEHERVVVDGTQNVRDGSKVQESSPSGAS